MLDALYREYIHWVRWLPVAIGFGIVLYFWIPRESYVGIALGMVGGASLCGAGLLFCKCLEWRFWGWGLIGIGIGFVSIWGKAQWWDPHMLHNELEPLRISGVIRSIDHLASAQRLFQRVIVEPQWSAWSKERHGSDLPKGVIITIRTRSEPLFPGQFLEVFTKLQPFQGAVTPWETDPRIFRFFQGIGARGFALSSPVIVKEASKPFLIDFAGLRTKLTRTIHENLPPPLGAIGCALVTGDKAAIPEAIRKDFSNAGLSHILAISGLHLSLVAGLCFLIFHRGLAWIPHLALYSNLQALAAFLALCLSWVYLNISGEGFPAQRSFLMTAGVLVALLFARRASSMRILTLVACIILLIEPEAVLSISFQLSFAAVTGLLCCYEIRNTFFQEKPDDTAQGKRLVKRWKGVLGKMGKETIRFMKNLFFSSFAASLFTMPLLMVSFSSLSFQGIFSNMLAIPLTSFLIVPLGIIALLSIFFGLEELLFPLWGKSLQLLVVIAQWSSEHLGAFVFSTPPSYPLFLWLALFGGLWLALWTQKWRFAGVLPFALGTLGLFFWSKPFPHFLVDPEKKVIGYVEAPTLWVSSVRSGRFAIGRWCEKFGQLNVQRMEPFQGKTPKEWLIVTLPTKERIAIVRKWNPNADYRHLHVSGIISWDPVPPSLLAQVSPIPHVVLQELPPRLGVTLSFLNTSWCIQPTAPHRKWSEPHS